MFRLIRLLILIFLAFAAGLFVGRGQDRAMCASLAGEWIDGVCLNTEHPSD